MPKLLASRPFRIALIILVLGGVGVGGLFALHKYRKRAALQTALASGTAAYEAKQYSKAAGELGRYLTANRRDIPVLLKYADAQTRCRPQSKGSVQQAINALETVLRIDPGHKEAGERLTGFYLALGSPIEAERVARAWLKASPLDAGAARQLASALLTQNRAEKTDEATSILKKAVADHPDDARCCRMLAFLMAGQKDGYVAAERLLEEAVKRNAQSAAMRLAQASFHAVLLAEPVTTAPSGREARPDPQEMARRTRQVISELDEAAKLSSTDVDILLELGQLYQDMGVQEKADSQFDLAEKTAPANPNIYLARAQAILRVEDPAAGAALADRMLAAPVGEQRFDLLPLAAEFYAMADRVDDAAKCIDELRRTSSPPEALVYLDGVIAMAKNETFKAAAAFEEAVRRSPQYARAHLLLGRCHVRNGQPRQAVSPMKEYVRLRRAQNDRAATGLLELARVYWTLGRFEEALKTVGEAGAWREARSTSVVAWARLTRVKMQAEMCSPRGAKPDATVIKSLYSDVKELTAAGSESAKSMTMQILLAQLTAWRGQPDEAVGILKAARDQLEDKLAATQALTDIYVEAGKYEQAVAECNTAIGMANSSQKPALQIRLAKIYSVKGEIEAARKALESAAADTGAGRTGLQLELARLLLDQKQTEQARELLIKIVSQDGRDLVSRLMLLATEPVAGKGPSRQELVEQVKLIEGPSGVNWRYWQAMVWLNAGDWASHSKEIASLLEECLTRDPEWDVAMLAMGSLYDKIGETNKALDFYRRGFVANPGNMSLGVRYLALAAKAERWNEVDEALGRLPKPEEVKDPALQQFLQQHRLAQAIRRGNTDQAVALLQARLADPKDFQARLQLAGIMQRAKDEAKAEALLAEAARIAPDSAEVLAAQVGLHLSRSRFDQALQLCDQALARKPDAQTRKLRARVQEAKGDLTQAESDLKQVAEDKNTAEEGYLALGRFQFRHSRSVQAIESWRKGLTAVPKSVQLRGAIIEVLLNSGDEKERQEAIRLVDERLTEDPRDPDFLLMRADILSPTKPKEAEELCEIVAQAHPNMVGAFARLANFAAARGQMDRAIQIVDRGLAGGGRDARLMLLRSQYLLADSPNRAATAAREVLEIQPDNESAAIVLSDALVRSGAGNEAIGELTKFLAQANTAGMVNARLALARLHALAAGAFLEDQNSAKASESLHIADELIQQAGALSPDGSGVVQARLLWHSVQGRWTELVSLANEHLKKKPDDIAVADYAGILLMEAKDPSHQSAAVDLFKRVVAQRPKDAAAYSKLGLAHFQAGRVGEARSTFEAGLAVDPKYLQLINDLAWILCEEQHDPNAAMKLAEKAVQDGADEPYFWDTWGVVLYRLGRLDESRIALEKAVAHPRVNAATRQSATLHLARTLAGTDKAASRRLLEELLKTPAEQMKMPATEQEEARKLLAQVSLVGVSQRSN